MSQKQYQQQASTLSSISRQINSILQSRKKVVDNIITKGIHQKHQIPQSYTRDIMSHCSQYSTIKRQVQQMTRNKSFFKTINQQNGGFWQMNEKIERQLQKRLKNLKEIDMNIEEMVEEEIEMAKEIEEIEETIRGILGKKLPDHISKAQPLYMQKESYIVRLQQMKRQKQSVKQQKLHQLTRILEILHQMKQLRQNRLQQCKQSSFSKQSITLLQCLNKDIEQLSDNQRLLQVHEGNQKKMLASVDQTGEKIHRLSRELIELLDAQAKTLEDISAISRSKAEMNCFGERLAGYFETSEEQLFSISQKFSLFIETETQKSTQLNQVQQGINTTQDTIEIFQNLKRNIETQALRKKELVEKIARLNKSYAIEKQRRQTISQKQVKIQGLKITYNKLQNLLQEAAEQADVKQYKIIHSQLDQLSRTIKTQLTQLQRLKSTKRQTAKRIYFETNNIQQQYRDLISQMFPQIWLRDNDFTKDQTIADFEIYLGKLFSRLKILA